MSWIAAVLGTGWWALAGAGVVLNLEHGGTPCLFTSDGNGVRTLGTGDLAADNALPGAFSEACGGTAPASSVSAVTASTAAAPVQTPFTVGFTTTGTFAYCTGEGSAFPVGASPD